MNIPPITWFSSITDIYTRVDIFPIDMRCLLCKSCRSIVTEPCKFCSKDRVKKKKRKKWSHVGKKLIPFAWWNPRYRLASSIKFKTNQKIYLRWLGINLDRKWPTRARKCTYRVVYIYIVDESAQIDVWDWYIFIIKKKKEGEKWSLRLFERTTDCTDDQVLFIIELTFECSKIDHPFADRTYRSTY